MRLHGILHMTGVYEKTANEVSVIKDGNERTSDGKESGNHCEKLEGLVRRLGHHVHNGTKWVEQQEKGQLLVENLQIEMDEMGYKDMGSPMPINNLPQVVCRIADTGSQVMIIGQELAKKLRVKSTEMVNSSMDVKGVDGLSLEVVGGIPVKVGIDLGNGG